MNSALHARVAALQHYSPATHLMQSVYRRRGLPQLPQRLARRKLVRPPPASPFQTIGMGARPRLAAPTPPPLVRCLALGRVVERPPLSHSRCGRGHGTSPCLCSGYGSHVSLRLLPFVHLSRQSFAIFAYISCFRCHETFKNISRYRNDICLKIRFTQIRGRQRHAKVTHALASRPTPLISAGQAARQHS